MIHPTKQDIGRQVVYVTKHGAREDGKITSFNKSVVFVRYRGDNLSKATRREDLEWL